MKKSNNVVLYLLSCFLIIKVGVVILTNDNNLATGDGISYNGYATAIVQNNDWLTNPDFTGDYRPPAYPILIACIYSIFGIENFVAVYIMQAIISTLTCFYVYKFSRKIFNNKAALLSLIWSGLYIFNFKYTGFLLRETLIFFLLIIFFYYLYLYLTDNQHKKQNNWLSIVFYFLLIHTDPRYLFFLPFLLLLFIIYQPIWIGLKKYLFFLGISLLLMVPWTIRNYVAYDAFVLINTRTIDLRDSKVSIRLNRLSIKKDTIANIDYPTEKERKIIKDGNNPSNRSIEEIEAIRKDKQAPNSSMGRRIWNLKAFWRPWKFSADYTPSGEFNGNWSLRHNVSSILSYGILLPFMIYSVIYLFKKKEKIIWVLLFPIVVQSLLHILMWGKERYRNPIDSFIIILGTYGIYIISGFIINQIKNKNHYEIKAS